MEQQESIFWHYSATDHYTLALKVLTTMVVLYSSRRMSLLAGSKYGMMGHHVDVSQMILGKNMLVLLFGHFSKFETVSK